MKIIVESIIMEEKKKIKMNSIVLHKNESKRWEMRRGISISTGI
jgi:hypothetical protein